MRSYKALPEVPGRVGERSRWKGAAPFVDMTELHFVFDDWLGDALVTSHPVFLVTAPAASAMNRHDVSGVRFKAVDVEVTDQFEELTSGVAMPQWRWAVVNGRPGVDDLGLDGNDLILSERVVDLLRSFGLEHCDLEDY